MLIRRLNYTFILYLALIEGLSLVVLDIVTKINFGILNGFLVGFVPALLVLLLYTFTSKYYVVKVNNKELLELPVLYLSVANGLFIFLLFLIQSLLPSPGRVIGTAVYGLLSVLLSSLVLILIYNKIHYKIRFTLDVKSVQLKEISVFASVYAGIFEFFILPLMGMFYDLAFPAFINGFLSGLIGGTIALYIVDSILEKKQLEISL